MSQFIEMYYNTHNKQTLESVCPIMNKGITPKYVESSSVLVINQACIHWDGQRLGNIKYHNEEIPVRKRILESGDVLLNATGNGTLGRCCVFICPSDNNTYINDGHVIALSTDRAVILPEVLNTYLSLNDTQAEIYRQYVTGSTNQVDIVFSDIKKMKVPVPSMDEQILFVEVLTQADKSKFGDFKSQFIEMVGDPRNNPKGWPTKRLSELAEYSIGLTYKPEQICDDGTIVLRSGNIQDGKISFSDIVRVNAPIKESLFVKEDDILMCSRNGSASLVGKVAMIPDINEPMTFGAFMTIIRSAEAKYLYLYFQSQDFRERVSEGKSSTMNQITQKMLDKVEVPFPDKDVRETLSAIASQADKSKSVIQKALVYLNDIQSDELGKIA